VRLGHRPRQQLTARVNGFGRAIEELLDAGVAFCEDFATLDHDDRVSDLKVLVTNASSITCSSRRERVFARGQLSVGQATPVGWAAKLGATCGISFIVLPVWCHCATGRHTPSLGFVDGQ